MIALGFGAIDPTPPHLHLRLKAIRLIQYHDFFSI